MLSTQFHLLSMLLPLLFIIGLLVVPLLQDFIILFGLFHDPFFLFSIYLIFYQFDLLVSDFPPLQTDIPFLLEELAH